MGWFSNLFRTQPQPSSINEGIASVVTSPWTEQELVAWINVQTPEHQRVCWEGAAEARRTGQDPLIILAQLRRRVESEQAEQPGLLGRMLDEYWDWRKAWWEVSLMHGDNPPIRVKHD